MKSTLEQIKEAWKMGWSANLIQKINDHQTRGGVIVSNPNLQSEILVRFSGNKIEKITPEQIEKMSIHGYLYGGELCGNGKIPEGQRFRVKHSGEIVTYKSEFRNGLDEALYLKGRKEPIYIKKIEIEPVFTQ